MNEDLELRLAMRMPKSQSSCFGKTWEVWLDEFFLAAIMRDDASFHGFEDVVSEYPETCLALFIGCRHEFLITSPVTLVINLDDMTI